MARRKGKIYSSPKGYKASLSLTDEGQRRRSKTNAWGASTTLTRKTNSWGAGPVSPDYKPGANAPGFFSRQPTETKEDMEARREAIEGLRETPTAFGGTGEHEADVLAAIASHGTVEASQRGMYSGRTVQPTSEKLGGGLTDRQKEGIDRSVRAEFDARVNAKMNGVAFTGAHSAEEQQMQADAYKSQVEKFRSDYAKAHPELADVIAKNNPSEPAAPSSGTVARTFAPGVGGYAVSAEQAGAKPEVQQPGKAAVTSPATSRQSEVDKAIADAEKLVSDLNAGKHVGQDQEEPSPADDVEDEFGVTADAKGGQTSAPGPVPVGTSAPPEPEEPQLVFGSRGEAASALMSRGAEMDYPTFAQAAAIASLPGPGDGPDYDPDASFAELVTGRISDELLSLAERVEAYDAEREDAYHASNAEAVAMAAGVSPEVYANAAPDERLYLQEKFMDSF